jgi:hypothetical protein
MERLSSINLNGKEYFYYPSDIFESDFTGRRSVYAQDAEGNEYTLILDEQNRFIGVEEGT